MKVHELAGELGLSNNDVQRTARRLGLNPRTSSAVLSPRDVEQIREEVAANGPTTVEVQNAVRASADAKREAALRPRQSDAHVEPVAVEPAKSGFQILAHEDYETWLLRDDVPQQVRRRANLIHEQIVARGEPTVWKRTVGVNKGWSRTPLGGSNKNQYYMYWAKRGHKAADPWTMPPRSVLIRDVRHHDRTNEPIAGAGEAHVLARRDAISEIAAPDSPYSATQREIAVSRDRVRIIKGHPGSGKTTSLFLRARVMPSGRLVYVTYSSRLAEDARAEFGAHLRQGVEHVVLTVDDLWAAVGGARVTAETRELVSVMETAMATARVDKGPWDGKPELLYAELYGHLVGGATDAEDLPNDARAEDGAAARQRYSERRSILGARATERAWAVGQQLSASLPALFPGPTRAAALLSDASRVERLARWLGKVDVFLVDEIQDLTRVELRALFAVLSCNARLNQHELVAFVAGDEGQTVRPTDFDWGALNGVIHEALGIKPRPAELDQNVRSPRAIAGLVNHSWGLYRRLLKEERPAGKAHADIVEDGVGRLLHCRHGGDSGDLKDFVTRLAQTMNVQWVTPSTAGLSVVGVASKEFLTSTEAKGLGFRTVAILNCGDRLLEAQRLAAVDTKMPEVQRLHARSIIDQLRVSISRSMDTLVFVEGSSPEANDALLDFLQPTSGDWSELALVNLSPEQLVENLLADFADTAARVEEYINRARAFLPDRPVQAAQNVEYALRLLEGAADSDGFDKSAMRSEAAAVGAEAKLIQAATSATSEFQTHLVEAVRLAKVSARPALAKLAGQLGDTDKATISIAATAIERAERALRELESDSARPLAQTAAEQYLLRRAGELVAIATSKSASEYASIWAALERLRILARYHNRHDDLDNWRDNLSAAATRSMLQKGSVPDAEKWLSRHRKPPVRLAAEVAERRDAWAEAAGLYEQDGDHGAALRCARSAPDLSNALRLAKQLGDASVVRRLEWMSRLLEATRHPEGDEIAAMTPAERNLLTGVLQAAASG